MAAPREIKERTAAAIVAAQEFSDVYYEVFDKRRQNISKMYKEDAQLVWNGNAFKGDAQISTFFGNLPDSEHTLEAMDTQPLIAGAVGAEYGSSFVVTVFGKVKFKTESAKVFSQTIILSVQDQKWKIISDTYRFQE